MQSPNIMNIFWLDFDPKTCAQMHCDKHVVKMILELAQLLCTAHRVLDGTQQVEIRTLSNGKTRRHKVWHLNDERDTLLYSATHMNHPCAIWVRECDTNYMLCYNLFVELCQEYTRRYKKVHLCETKLKDLLVDPPANCPFSPTATDPPQAMPEEYRVSGDPITAYRNYYKGGKSNIAQWNHSDTPAWFVSNI